MPAMKRPITPPVAKLKLIRAADFKRRYSPSALRDRLQENLGLRIISLLLAIGLWIFVNAGQHSSVAPFNIPVSYRGLPPGFVITNPHPDFVKIQLTGPQTLLSLVDPSRLTLKLDLSGVGVGQASFKIGLDSFNVPRGTAVTSISPSQIVLDVDKIVFRYLPVHVVTVGTPADGYRITSIETSPPTVHARAPSKQLAGLSAIATEAVDVTGLTAGTERVAAVTSVGGMMRLDPAEVMVKIAVAPVIATKDFRAVPVAVRNSDYQAKLQPSRINLSLRGPKLDLNKLDLSNSVFVDADGMESGTYNVPVQVQLPPGMDLLHIWPDKVKITIMAAARH
ncbi:MAG TPA: CdaR family protein [Candidatus Binataceae bacterium]|nr:CdaR family protein [Candidatus Binataceae bacterium]